jgi:hypothetical protein
LGREVMGVVGGEYVWGVDNGVLGGGGGSFWCWG